MKKLTFLLSIFFIVSCGEKEKVYEPSMYQTITLEDCIICEDPWSTRSELVEDTFRGKISKRLNEWGDNSKIFEGALIIDNMSVEVPKNNRDFTRMKLHFNYYSQNCWSERNRKSSITINNIGSWVKTKSKELIRNAKTGDKFDVLLIEPELYINYPEHACDYFHIDLETRDFFIFPPETLGKGYNGEGEVDMELFDKYK